jgi:hypothetical protein
MAAAAVLAVALIAAVGIPRQATTTAALMQFDVDHKAFQTLPAGAGGLRYGVYSASGRVRH